jgi:hypothetical protein
MYGIYANIGGILMVNVTIYTIHGSYGYWKWTLFWGFWGHLPSLTIRSYRRGTRWYPLASCGTLWPWCFNEISQSRGCPCDVFKEYNRKHVYVFNCFHINTYYCNVIWTPKMPIRRKATHKKITANRSRTPRCFQQYREGPGPRSKMSGENRVHICQYICQLDVVSSELRSYHFTSQIVSSDF